MKKKKLETRDLNELKELLLKGQKDLVDLRIQNTTRKLKNPHEINLKRKEIARIITKMNEGHLAKP
ncbi:MAG: 50S ribosomal protein L29 [Candidatus Woykebacteria bacterium]